VDYLYATRERLSALIAGGVTAPPKLPKELIAARDAAESSGRRADDALADDLNTSVAIAELGELAKHANEVCDLALRRAKDGGFQGSAGVVAHLLSSSMARITAQLGVLLTPFEEYRRRTRARRLAQRSLTEADVERRVAQRMDARKAKDFARSDAIRDELLAQGISVHDGPTGSTWTIAV
jgi:cysteinyl-tRNA synthetase